MFDTQLTQMNTAVAEQCFGCFFFSDEMLKKEPDIIQKIFSKVIPLEVNYDYCQQAFRVKACCKEFEPLELGEIIPYYRVFIRQVVNKSKNKSIYITFEKIQE